MAPKLRGRYRGLGSVERHTSVIAHMIRGCQLAQMISVAAKLRIADRLQNGPLTASNLAEATGSHEDSLYRLLRALAGVGIFAEEPGRHFRLSPASEPLLSAVPGSMRIRAEVMGEALMWNSWGALLHSVQTGETAFDHVYGKNTFDWFREHPDSAQLFDAFQAEVTAGLIDDILSGSDFSHVNVVVDVAGGTGTLLSEILRRYPKSRGILF